MLFPSDIEDDNQFDFSVFDRTKIEDLELNEKIEAESGSFLIVRKRNGYHVWCQRGKQTGVYCLPTLEKVFEFLESN